VLQAHCPRAGLVGPPGEEIPGALQDVSYHPLSLCHEFFNLSCLLNSTLSSRRHADTGVLSLAPLKRLALSAQVVPFEPHPQPPCRAAPGAGWGGAGRSRRGGGIGCSTAARGRHRHRGGTDIPRDDRPKRYWSHRPGPAQVARTW
jgi:hypothetical protein